MPNPYHAPEISPRALSDKAAAGTPFVWLDVREPWEVRRVQIDDARVLSVPLSDLAEQGIEALPPAAQDRDAEIVVQCHHGTRSAQVVMWLQQQGWNNAVSLAGGVAAWADEVDAAIGRY